MRLLLTAFLFLLNGISFAQDSTVVLSSSMYNASSAIPLADLEGWVFKKGNDRAWAAPGFNTDGWEKLKPTQLTEKLADKNGKLDGWFRVKLKLDSSFSDSLLGIGLIHARWAAADIYIDGVLFHSFGSTGSHSTEFKEYNDQKFVPVYLDLITDKEYVLAVHLVDFVDPVFGKLKSGGYKDFLTLTGPKYIRLHMTDVVIQGRLGVLLSTVAGLLAILFWMIYFQNNRERHLLLIALTATTLFVASFNITVVLLENMSHGWNTVLGLLTLSSLFTFFIIMPITVGQILKKTVPKIHWWFAGTLFVMSIVFVFFQLFGNLILAVAIISSFIICVWYTVSSRKSIFGASKAVVAGLLVSMSSFLMFVISVLIFKENTSPLLMVTLLLLAALSFPLSLLVYVSMWFKESRKAVEANAQKVIQITEEKKELLENQNVLLEQQVNERTAALNQSLESLKATQKQLIQSEKMASLGELTAGIAHEIQNPLNFVNNFSEVNNELIEELKSQKSKLKSEEQDEILNDIFQNNEKIHHHGKRADAIVKGMLQHSLSSKGVKEPTDINALADEYLRLAYHGLRAKDKTFNALLKTDYDESISNIDIIPQDMGRVILNLISNAFYAVNEKSRQNLNGYEPMVSVSTKRVNGSIELKVQDNGNGIPQHVMDKIFQPFFTTKPTGQGTGLGLSLAYDIVKAHGGELKVDTKEGEGSTFIVQFPKHAS